MDNDTVRTIEAQGPGSVLEEIAPLAWLASARRWSQKSRVRSPQENDPT